MTGEKSDDGREGRRMTSDGKINTCEPDAISGSRTDSPSPCDVSRGSTYGRTLQFTQRPILHQRGNFLEDVARGAGNVG